MNSNLFVLLLIAGGVSAGAIPGKDATGPAQESAGPAAIEPARRGPTEKERSIVKASAYIGKPVRNSAGEELGVIVDLAIDGQLGRVIYAAMGSGGFLGLGQRLYAIPIGVLGPPIDGEDLILDIPRGRLEVWEGFDADHWPARPDHQLIDRVQPANRDKSPVPRSENTGRP